MIVRRIIVGYDFTEAADDAMAWALALAEPLKAQVDLVYVAEAGADETALSERRAALARVAEEVGAQVVTRVVPGDDVARALVDDAEEANADLIVVATRALSAVQRWFLGSVADALIRTAHCPVVTVRSGDGD